MKKINVSIVVPLYNERESVKELQQTLEKVLGAERFSFECIYVDDGSTDGSFGVLKETRSGSRCHMTLIRLRKHMGKSAALAVGFSHARGVNVVTIDADLQDDPREIPKLLKKIDEGYQLVCGWRVNRNDVWHKKMLSRIFNRIVSLATGIPLHDFNTGLKVYTNNVVKEITLYGELHRFTPVLAAARGFRVAEVPVHHYKRKYGSSKYGMKRTIHAALDLTVTLFLISFKQQPMQLFGLTGGISVTIGIFLLLYLSYLHFLGESIGRRPLLVLGMLLVLFGVQLISTGLLAEMFTNYNQRKDAYPIEEIVE